MIDHLVLPVATLALARARLASLGFTVAPEARHPFGTGNACVFFANRTYLEPIAVLDRGAADRAAAEGNFFVRRLRRYTERHAEGFAMLAMKSEDAAAAAAALAAAGYGGEGLSFRRKAAAADGAEKEIGVRLAFAEIAAAPDATFFVCQHLSPDALYDPTWLAHANGAGGVVAVAAVAEEAGRFADYVAAVAGRREKSSVDVLTPAEFADRYGVRPPQTGGGLRLAAFDIASDLDAAARFAGPSAVRRGERLVVPPAPGLGAVLAFEAADG
jgi:hypothetical protein